MFREVQSAKHLFPSYKEAKEATLTPIPSGLMSTRLGTEASTNFLVKPEDLILESHQEDESDLFTATALNVESKLDGLRAQFSELQLHRHEISELIKDSKNYYAQAISPK